LWRTGVDEAAPIAASDDDATCAFMDGLWFDRRTVMSGITASLACACAPRGSEGAALTTPVSIAILGDSITSGYGLTPEQALPAALHASLLEIGLPNEVKGLGVDGETTAAALSRVEEVVVTRPDIAVVALGGNDILQGAPPDALERNLDRIVAALQTEGLFVLLAGLRAPPVVAMIAPQWAKAYEAAFAQVAEKRRAAFHPSLLADVAFDPRYNQKDRIHPNAQGVKLIARRLAQRIAQVLAERAATT
jgi:acyl-CoA thioesterase I